MNLHYSIRICTKPIFDSRPLINNKIFLKKLIKVGSSHLYASFGTYCVKIGKLFNSQWKFILSEDFEKDDFFFRKQRFDRFQTFFKDSLCVQLLTNLDAKCFKRSVKMWATNCYKSFFQKNVVVNERLDVKNTFSNYVWSKVDSCFCEALYPLFFNLTFFPYISGTAGATKDLFPSFYISFWRALSWNIWNLIT